MEKILFIMGTPNVGKSTLINMLLHYSDKFYLPQHCTNRPPRNDDDGFYCYMRKENFAKEIMYIWAKDKFDRYYGVLKNTIKEGEKYAIINCSLKNIEEVLSRVNRNPREMKICILLTHDIVGQINLGRDKYSLDEREYRIQETLSDVNFLTKFISDKKKVVYYIDEYKDLEKIVNNIMSDLRW